MIGLARIVKTSLKDLYEKYRKTPQSIREINISLKQQLINTQKLLLRIDVVADSVMEDLEITLRDNKADKQILIDQLDEMYRMITRFKRLLSSMSAYAKALESIKEDLYREIENCSKEE